MSSNWCVILSTWSKKIWFTIFWRMGLNWKYLLRLSHLYHKYCNVRPPKTGEASFVGRVEVELLQLEKKDINFNAKSLFLSRYGGWMGGWVITNLIYWFFGKQNCRFGMEVELKSAKVCIMIWCFWPLTASTTSEV